VKEGHVLRFTPEPQGYATSAIGESALTENRTQLLRIQDVYILFQTLLDRREILAVDKPVKVNNLVFHSVLPMVGR
jgi:hypothetical protein